MYNYNYIAPIYDLLKTLVFGKSILASQLVHLDRINSHHEVLILGGGSGELLEHIDAKNIDYVEPSIRMMNRAKRRDCPTSNINFYLEKFEDYEMDKKYDVVICQFFLDLFTDEELPVILSRIDQSLTGNGKLLVSDFQNPNKKYHVFLESMIHTFFRLTTNLARNRFADLRKELCNANYLIERSNLFYNGFVFSVELRSFN